MGSQLKSEGIDTLGCFSVICSMKTILMVIQSLEKKSTLRAKNLLPRNGKNLLFREQILSLKSGPELLGRQKLLGQVFPPESVSSYLDYSLVDKISWRISQSWS